MREIKFRGLCIRRNVWVYGYLSSEMVINTEKGRLKVHPTTIGQFTGLKDKNGVEIYEGDICLYKGEKTHYIMDYFCDFGCYGLLSNGDEKPKGRNGSSTKYEPYFMNKYHTNKIKVIGNIYENEL